jgi:acyl-CoA reductase-like NAD-dependent aldehyde dehydrogenase
MELGGNAPFIVFDGMVWDHFFGFMVYLYCLSLHCISLDLVLLFNADADLEVAVKALIQTKFRNAGQACIASNRILVHEKIYDKFSNMLAEKVAKMKIGNGLQNGVSIGIYLLISIDLIDNILHHIFV